MTFGRGSERTMSVDHLTPANFEPWGLVTYIAFSDEQKAMEFERYLKSASGRAFANKRLR
jgi:hypothetical protein